MFAGPPEWHPETVKASAAAAGDESEKPHGNVRDCQARGEDHLTLAFFALQARELDGLGGESSLSFLGAVRWVGRGERVHCRVKQVLAS